MNCSSLYDPLVLHLDGPLSDPVQKATEAIRGHVFRPSLLSMRGLTGGNMQTLMSPVKEKMQSLVQGQMPYDKKEIFILSDGGHIIIQYKGKSFLCRPEAQQLRPLIFIIVGMTSDAQSGYVRNMVRMAERRGYDVVVIGYRGIGLELATPRLHYSYATDDVLEPMKHVYDTYCRDTGRKVFAIGTSMGGNILCNLLGDFAEDCFLDGACVIHAPMKKWKIKRALQTSMNGQYDKHLGEAVVKVLDANRSILRSHFKEEHDIDLDAVLTEHKANPSALELENWITAPNYGYENQEDYYRKAACVHRIPKIQTPTLFMNSLDDPILGEAVIAFEEIKANENCLLGTNRSGGHLGYHESLFSFDVWFMRPVLDFLGALQ